MICVKLDAMDPKITESSSEACKGKTSHSICTLFENDENFSSRDVTRDETLLDFNDQDINHQFHVVNVLSTIIWDYQGAIVIYSLDTR